MLTSAIFRAKAREILRNHWQTALLIALAVNLPSLLVQGISAFTGNDLFARVETLVLSSARDGVLTDQRLTAGLREILSDTGVLTMMGFSVLAWLIVPCLELGMNHWLLLRVRGKDGPFSTVFSRLSVSHKAIGLRLLVTLKILLWMLPGAGVFALSFLPVWRADPTNAAAVSSALNSTMLLTYVSLAVMLVPAVMAALRYALADILLADLPEKRITDCVRESKALMTGRKAQLFSLELSFIFWYLAEILVSTMISGIGGNIPALMFQMLAGLALSAYMQASVVVFAEALRKAPAASEIHSDDSPSDDEIFNS